MGRGGEWEMGRGCGSIWSFAQSIFLYTIASHTIASYTIASYTIASYTIRERGRSHYKKNAFYKIEMLPIRYLHPLPNFPLI